MLFGNAIDKAAAKLRELQDTRRKLAGKALAVSEELNAAREVNGDRVLDGLLLAEAAESPHVGVRQRIVEMENQLEDLAIGQRALARRIQDQVAALFEARADVIREKLRKVESRLAEHNRKTAEMLQHLQDHSGFAYVVELQPPGSALVNGRIVGVERSRTVPPAVELALQIEALQAEIIATENRAQHRAEGGVVTAHSLAELLADVSADVERIVPFAEEIAAWHTGATKAARRSSVFAGYVPDSETELIYILAWGPSGRIDVARSEARVGSRPYAPPIRAVVAA